MLLQLVRMKSMALGDVEGLEAAEEDVEAADSMGMRETRKARLGIFML